jgi:putative transposase
MVRRVARKVRIEYPGAVYHLMNRGDGREAIFRNDADRELLRESATEKESSVNVWDPFRIHGTDP